MARAPFSSRASTHPDLPSRLSILAYPPGSLLDPILRHKPQVPSALRRWDNRSRAPTKAFKSCTIGDTREDVASCGLIETREPGSIGRFQTIKGGSSFQRLSAASGFRDQGLGRAGGEPLLTLQYPSQVIPNRPPLQNGTLGPLLNRGTDAF